MRKIGKRNSERGSAQIEFAVAAIALLLLVFGIVDMGRALFAYNFVSQTARNATRWVMLRGTGCPSQLGSYCPAGATNDDVTTYVKSIAPGIDTTTPGVLTVTSACGTGSGLTNTLPCTPSNGTPATYVQVTVTYQFSFITPLSGLVALIPSSGLTSTWNMASSSERVLLQ